MYSNSLLTSAGSGGIAMVISASGVALGNSTVTVNANGYGGNGGSSAGTNANGGNGGITSFVTQPYGQSSGGNVSVTGILNGGNGGAASGSGNGGNGVGISIVNQLSGSTSGSLYLEQDAYSAGCRRRAAIRA